MIINDEYLKRLEIVGHSAELLIQNDEIRFYSCEIEDGVSAVVIEAEPQNDTYVCEGDLGEAILRKGVNTFTIRVLRDHALVMEYKISIVLKKSLTSVKLRAIEVNGVLAEPVMRDGEIAHYYYKCEPGTKQIFVDVYPETSDMEVEGDIGDQEVEAGSNSFMVIVKSGDGKVQKDYELIVDQDEDGVQGDVYDSEPEAYDPESEVYDPEPKVYDLEPETYDQEPYDWKPESVPDTKISAPEWEEPEWEESEQKLQLENIIVMGITHEAQFPKDDFLSVLENGGEDFEILKNHKTADDSYLNIPLCPEFSPEIEGYSMEVDIAITAIFVAAYPLNSKDLVTGDVGYQKLEGDDNVFTILVMGERGSRQYGLTVNRVEPAEDLPTEPMVQEVEEEALGSEARLILIELSGGTLVPEFSPDLMSYTVIPDEGQNMLHIHAVPMSDQCEVSGDLGERQILQGENTYTINTIAEDKQECHTYCIQCTGEEIPLAVEAAEKKGKKKRKKAKKINSLSLKLKMLKKKFLRDTLKEKKVVRTAKLIHRLMVIIVLMCSLSYLLNTFLLTTVRETYQSRQSVYSVVNRKRVDVEKHLKNKEAIIQSIDQYQQEQREWSEVYPFLPSQEELLLFLNELGTRITFEYNIVNISVSAPVFAAEVNSTVVTKNMADVVPDILTAAPPTVKAETPTPGEGTEPKDVQHELQRNVASIAIQGRYEDVLGVYTAIIENPRLIVTDIIQMTREKANAVGIENPEGANETWQLNADLIFYSFTGLDDQV